MIATSKCSGKLAPRAIDEPKGANISINTAYGLSWTELKPIIHDVSKNMPGLFDTFEAILATLE